MNYYTTGQLAKKFNISVRTLRYYDQIELLCPLAKTDSGKRLYSESDCTRLEKILLLKELAVPLEQMRSLLNEISDEALLTSHYNYLQQQLVHTQQSIDLTASMIHMVQLEQKVDWSKLTKMAQQRHHSKAWLNFFNEEEQQIVNEIVPNLKNNDAITARYIQLMKEIEFCLRYDITPQSKAGIGIAQALLKLTEETFGGDDTLSQKFWEVRKLPTAETGLYPISEEVLKFAEQCISYIENKDECNGCQ